MRENDERICGNCALKHPKDQTCLIFRESFPAEQSACPKFTKTIRTCALCGNILLTPGILELIDSTYINYHDECAKYMGTCQTCGQGALCSFKTDPSPIPPVIMQTQRQGNMVIQQQVKNPERIEATCAKGCPCYDPTVGCLKEEGYCGKWAYRNINEEKTEEK